MFSTALKKAFQKLNMYPHHFNTHSFRIGAATSAKKKQALVTHTSKHWAGGEAMHTLNMFGCHLKESCHINHFMLLPSHYYYCTTASLHI